MKSVNGSIAFDVEVGVIANASLSVFACVASTEICQSVLSASVSGTSAFNITGSVGSKTYYGSCSNNDCSTAYLSPISFSTQVSGEWSFGLLSGIYTASTPKVVVSNVTQIGQCN